METKELVLKYLKEMLADEDCMLLANEMHGHDEDIPCNPGLVKALSVVIEHMESCLLRHSDTGTMAETKPLSIYTKHCVICPNEKLDCSVALTFFRGYLNDPTYSLNKLTRFMARMGHPRAKGGGLSYYKGIKLISQDPQ